MDLLFWIIVLSVVLLSPVVVGAVFGAIGRVFSSVLDVKILPDLSHAQPGTIRNVAAKGVYASLVGASFLSAKVQQHVSKVAEARVQAADKPMISYSWSKAVQEGKDAAKQKTVSLR